MFLKRDTWERGDIKQASSGFELSQVAIREQLESFKSGCLSRMQLTKCVAYSFNVSRCFLFNADSLVHWFYIDGKQL